MQIVAFYGTLDQAREVRHEMLISGFDPLEVGVYAGSEAPPEERETWFDFASSEDRALYQEAIRRGATAVVVDLPIQPSELGDGEIAIEVLERYRPLDVARWARDWASPDEIPEPIPPGESSGPIADWRPADRPAERTPMRRGIRCHGEERGPEAGRGAVPERSAMARFVREFAGAPGHAGRDWSLVEGDLQRQFASRYPGSDWGRVKDRLQEEYDHARSSEARRRGD